MNNFNNTGATIVPMEVIFNSNYYIMDQSYGRPTTSQVAR